MGQMQSSTPDLAIFQEKKNNKTENDTFLNASAEDERVLTLCLDFCSQLSDAKLWLSRMKSKEKEWKRNRS